MDNAGVVATNLNELNVLENLRDSRAFSPRPEPVAPPDQETDLVQLSQQSLQLYQVFENAADERVNPAPEAETAALEQEPQQAGTAENAANGVPYVDENAGIEEQDNLLLRAEDAAPQTEEREENLIERLNNTIEAFEAAVPRTTEGSVARGSEAATIENPAEGNPRENSNPLETQVNQVNQANEVLANANAYGFPANSAVTNVDRAPETAQYQQQVLLQNVGTQLAQAVPPSSIFSLLA